MPAVFLDAQRRSEQSAGDGVDEPRGQDDRVAQGPRAYDHGFHPFGRGAPGLLKQARHVAGRHEPSPHGVAD